MVTLSVCIYMVKHISIMCLCHVLSGGLCTHVDSMCMIIFWGMVEEWRSSGMYAVCCSVTHVPSGLIWTHGGSVYDVRSGGRSGTLCIVGD